MPSAVATSCVVGVTAELDGRSASADSSISRARRRTERLAQSMPRSSSRMAPRMRVEA